MGEEMIELKKYESAMDNAAQFAMMYHDAFSVLQKHGLIDEYIEIRKDRFASNVNNTI